MLRAGPESLASWAHEAAGSNLLLSWLLVQGAVVSGGVGVAVVAVNAKTGTLVYDHFHDGPQRMELDTRLRQLAVSSHGCFGHARIRHTWLMHSPVSPRVMCVTDDFDMWVVVRNDSTPQPTLTPPHLPCISLPPHSPWSCCYQAPRSPAPPRPASSTTRCVCGFTRTP